MAPKKVKAEKTEDVKTEDVKAELLDEKPAATPAKAAKASPVKKGKAGRHARDQSGSDEEEEEAVNWWESEDIQGAISTQRGEKRWTTLHHNGVILAPPYEPHGVAITYNGMEFKLHPEEEEIVTMFAVMRETEYYQKPVFRENFFRDFRAILAKHRPEGHPIKRLEMIGFDAIWQWHLRQKLLKESRTLEEKKAIREAKAKEDAKYKFCLWDGRKEEITAFRVEPPNLFRGRGDHPKTGQLKRRIMPEDIIINISADAPVPPCPEGHRWKEVIHDNTVTWLAMWRDHITDGHKYVMPGASSAVKGLTDREKFERARRLKDVVDRIREKYTKGWTDKDVRVQQRSVAMYFIDKLALRVGNEKNTDEEAETVGCCSLKVGHVMPMEGGNILHFDFLGKDSIRYVNDVEVDPAVYRLITAFRRNKDVEAKIFDTLTPAQLNDALKEFMPDLTAKVFRTYNASITLERELAKNPCPKDATVAEKLVYFNAANTRVAELCNHQRSVGVKHRMAMAALGAKSELTVKALEIIEQCKKIESDKGVIAAKKHYLAAHDALQREWLEQHGTDDQKKEFEQVVANRKQVTDSGSKKSSKKGGKAAAKKKTAKKAGATKAATKKPAAKKAAAAKPAAKQPAAKKAAAKKPAAKKPAAKKPAPKKGKK
jgi:DNA topoisomerase-1